MRDLVDRNTIHHESSEQFSNKVWKFTSAPNTILYWIDEFNSGRNGQNTPRQARPLVTQHYKPYMDASIQEKEGCIEQL